MRRPFHEAPRFGRGAGRAARDALGVVVGLHPRCDPSRFDTSRRARLLEEADDFERAAREGGRSRSSNRRGVPSGGVRGRNVLLSLARALLLSARERARASGGFGPPPPSRFKRALLDGPGGVFHRSTPPLDRAAPHWSAVGSVGNRPLSREG